jgi:hypothetical protein
MQNVRCLPGYLGFRRISSSPQPRSRRDHGRRQHLSAAGASTLNLGQLHRVVAWWSSTGRTTTVRTAVEQRDDHRGVPELAHCTADPAVGHIPRGSIALDPRRDPLPHRLPAAARGGDGEERRARTRGAWSSGGEEEGWDFGYEREYGHDDEKVSPCTPNVPPPTGRSSPASVSRRRRTGKGRE